MVKTVVREHHWFPSEVSKLYLDNIDHHGLMFWYEDVKEVFEKTKPKK